jgi:hypothetical protein
MTAKLAALEKETDEDVKQDIVGKLFGIREKAYLLQTLLGHELDNCNEDISFDHAGMIFSGAEVIMGEIVKALKEAGELVEDM